MTIPKLKNRRPHVRVIYRGKRLIARTTDHNGTDARVWVGNTCYFRVPWQTIEAAIVSRVPLEVR